MERANSGHNDNPWAYFGYFGFIGSRFTLFMLGQGLDTKGIHITPYFYADIAPFGFRKIIHCPPNVAW